MGSVFQAAMAECTPQITNNVVMLEHGIMPGRNVFLLAKA